MPVFTPREFVGFYNVKHFGATGDGTTDDSAAIRLAIATVSDRGGGTVFFPNGTYIVSREVGPLFGGCIAISEGVNLLGESKLGAIIKLAPDQPTFTRMLTVDSADDVIISNLTLDGNRSNQAVPEEHMGGIFAGSYGGEQFRLTVRDCNIHDCCGDGITIYGTARDTLIEGCYIYDCGRDGIAITGAGAARTTIRNCQIVDCFAQAVDGEPQDGITYDLTVENCYLRRSTATPDYAFATSGPFVGQDNGLVFINNIVEGACCIRARANIQFCNNKITTTSDDGVRRPLELDGETYDAVVDGNIFEAVATGGGAVVRITGRSTGYPEAPYHIIFSNNIIRSNDSEGLQLLGAHSVKVINNEITGYSLSTHPGIEVRAQMAMSRVELVNNHIQDYLYGIQVWGVTPTVGVDELVVIGNVAEALSHPNMTAWSLNYDSLDLVKQATVIGNEARNCTVVFSAIGGWPAGATLIGGNRGAGGVYSCEGTPEGQITEVVGAIARRRDGSGGLVEYVKASGTGDTGWLPVGGAVATGSITCIAKADIVDGETISIGDGTRAAVVYEFDPAGDGVAAGRVQVNLTVASDASDVAAALKLAIEVNQPLIAVTDAGGGVLQLAHKIAGTLGNVTITDTVADTDFLVTGMSGGVNPAR